MVVGDHNLSQNDGTEQYVSVQKIVVHPNWNKNNVAAGYEGGGASRGVGAGAAWPQGMEWWPETLCVAFVAWPC